MSYQITDEHRRAYDEDGACVLRGLVDAEWQAKLADAIERDIENPGPFYHGYESENGVGRFHGNLKIWQNDPVFHDFCHASVLPEVAQQFFGSKRINLMYDQLFVKEPGTINPTRWHNDQPYWAVKGWEVLSFWMSLDRVTKDSGAMSFIRGSHKWDRWFQPEKFGKNPGVSEYEPNENYEPMPDVDAHLEDYEFVTWDLEPGDALVFHALTVHGAGGNLHQDRRRRGYTVRYTGDDAFYDTRPGTNVGLRDASLKDGDPLSGASYPVVIGP